MIRSLLLCLLLMALSISIVEASDDLCLLCEDGINGLKYPNAVIKSDGTTCTQLAVDIAVNYNYGNDKCYKQLEAWRQICCGDSKPVNVEITDVFDDYPDIDSIQTLGPYNKCDVCRDGDYPSASSMVITMLYIGSGSCPQYWKAGQQGLIPDHLCDPLQYFAYEPCGCGEFSTNGNYNWGDSYDGDTPPYNNNNNKEDDDNWWSGADALESSDSRDYSYDGRTDDNWWGGADSHHSKAAPTRFVRVSWLVGIASITTTGVLMGLLQKWLSF